MIIIRRFFIFCILISFINPQSGLSQINFSEHLIDNSTDGTSGIFATDLDNDDDIDVLVASSEDDQIIWFRNDGGTPVNWNKIIIGANVGSAHSVYAADIDNDDDLDVVGAAYWGTPGITWWRNDGGEPVVWTKFTVAQNFINAHEIYVHDLDNDDDYDILGASSNLNTISWWKNDGGNPIVWTEQTISDEVTLAKSVHVGDFDNDGDNDVVGAAISANEILWWRNDGGNPIVWTEFQVDEDFVGPHRVQSIDMDNDGDEDILCASYSGSQVAWWRNEGGNPIVWNKQIIGVLVWQACIATAVDIDKDNDLDVIATAQGTDEVVWWRNDGNASTSWTKFTITDDFTRPWPLFVIDMNDDEYDDIIVGSSYNGNMQIKWWENDGSTTDTPGHKLNKITISPNPAKDRIFIDRLPSSHSKLNILLVNTLGQTIISKSISSYNTETSLTIDVSAIPQGEYILKIIDNTTMVSEKIIKIQ